VVVTNVDDNSAADEAGIQQGDIIEQVGGKTVTSTASLTKMLKDAKASRKHAALLVYRDGRAQFIPLSLSE